MQKKGKIITAILVAYAVLSLAVVFLQYSSHSPLKGFISGAGLQGGFVNEMTEFTPTPVQWAQAQAQDAAGEGLFRLLPTDGERLQDRFALPALERMEQNERAALVESSQVMRRIVRLGVDIEQFQTPELAYKRVCQAVTEGTAAQSGAETLSFTGDSVSALNEFMAALNGAPARISVESGALTMDAVLTVPGGVCLEGRQTRLTPGEGRLERAISLTDAKNSGVSGFIVEGGCDYGVWIEGGEGIVLSDNRVCGAAKWGVSVSGEGRLILIRDNELRGNGGGLLLNGAVSLGLVQRNTVAGSTGGGSMEAGIALCGAGLLNDGMDGVAQDVPAITGIESAPCGVALVENRVEGNAGAGVICSAGYLDYFVGNTVSGNDGEGLRLDRGSFGCYVSANTVMRNGDNARPGVLLDNAAYNTVYGNMILENYGSGIECESTVHRTLMLCNEITDNNRGSLLDRGYGIEFGVDVNQPARGRKVDHMACCENIVARNMINGGHTSAVYLGRDSASNDFFDNTFMGCTQWSIENRSEKYNASVNNLSSVKSLGISLSDLLQVNVVHVADRVD